MKTLLLCFVLLPAPAIAQSQLSDLRARFVHDPDPVHKAKEMQKLGEAEFQEIDADFSSGKMSDALMILGEYRDEVEVCEKGLDAKEVDPERHPGGFKQLQISTRESLRQLDQLLSSLTTDQQAPFLALRKDLDRANLHLIHELFPTPSPSGGARAK